MSKFVGYRAPKLAGGGLQNGYNSPKAKQSWLVGDVVNVGFVKNLMVLGKNADGAVHLRQLTSDRFYTFLPHLGLERVGA